MYAYQQTVLNADQEVENGLVTFLKAQRQAKLQSASVDDAEKAVVIVLAQYKAGAIDFTRVTQLEQFLVQQQYVLAVARGRNRHRTDSGLRSSRRRLANPAERLRTNRVVALGQTAPGCRAIARYDPRAADHSTRSAAVRAYRRSGVSPLLAQYRNPTNAEWSGETPLLLPLNAYSLSRSRTGPYRPCFCSRP